MVLSAGVRSIEAVDQGGLGRLGQTLESVAESIYAMFTATRFESHVVDACDLLCSVGLSIVAVRPMSGPGISCG